MTRMENEDAVKFANRVKAEIARQGGLVDLVWYVQFCYSFLTKSWIRKVRTSRGHLLAEKRAIHVTWYT